MMVELFAEKLNMMLCNDLKRAVHTRRPKNMADLKQISKEGWFKIPFEYCVESGDIDR
ncbi:hypothetical protein EXN66_Car015666 [Channa argus]|uniref:Uncharacterized protein n=1 Tax=Channa argus TaxID=215402 RepID=A0A6G1QC47_CHAAH|nr:hypothetical protein EXN66_Car015666 [Channa argus]